MGIPPVNNSIANEILQRQHLPPEYIEIDVRALVNDSDNLLDRFRSLNSESALWSTDEGCHGG
jgi:hypothetical protein